MVEGLYESVSLLAKGGQLLAAPGQHSRGRKRCRRVAPVVAFDAVLSQSTVNELDSEALLELVDRSLQRIASLLELLSFVAQFDRINPCFDKLIYRNIEELCVFVSLNFEFFPLSIALFYALFSL